MRWVLTILLSALLAAPLFAVKVKLKSEDKEVETTLTSLSGDIVSYKRGRKDATARLDDFEPASAFLIKKSFTAEDATQVLELARFALHRGLYLQARETARSAARLDAAQGPDAQAVADIADILEADQLLESASNQLEAGKPVDARKLLAQILEKFPKTPAAIKAEVLLGTIDSVELELKSRQLEEEARKAQETADADERKKRQPVDDWLATIADQTKSLEDKKIEADADCNAGRTPTGLPKYESTVSTAIRLRKTMEDNRKWLKYRGQPELADKLDARALRTIIDCYERWGFFLYRLARYDMAAEVVAKGIALDPKDRRLLSLKVDIDELYDPTESN